MDKRIRKVRIVLLICLCMVLMSSVSAQALTTIYLKKGQQKNLTVPLSMTQLDQGLASSRYSWNSSKSSVVKVTGTSRVGRIYAKKNGSATITAKCSGAYKAWKVVVGNKSSSSNSGSTSNSGSNNNSNSGSANSTVKKVAVKSIKLNKTSLTLNTGKSATLKYTISPKKAKTTVNWKSSNSSVASVSGGKVTAKKRGTATITVTTSNGKKKSCKVTVKAPATKVTLPRTYMDLGKGDKIKLTATVSPSNTTDKLKWTTSNKKVATVSLNGTVKAKKAGKAIITAKCGSKKATCVFWVSANRIKQIKPVKSSVVVARGNKVRLGYKLSPANAGGTLTWSSNKTGVAKVDEYGNVTAVSVGTATITVKAPSGASAKFTVKVDIPANKVELTKYVKEMEVGESYQFAALVYPSNTTDSLTWSSDNPSVAKVNSSGKVTAVKAGTTYIWANTESCSSGVLLTVTPKEPIATKIQITGDRHGLNVGSSINLTCNAYYGTTLEDISKKATWKSSDTSVAYVSAYGVVNAKKKGTAVITAYYQDKSASFLVEVTEDADISKGDMEIYNGYYTQWIDGKSVKFDYNPAEGLRIVQSASQTYMIDVYANTKIILSGVQIEAISSLEEGLKVVVEQENGSVNHMLNGLRLHSTSELVICGNGTLYTTTYGTALGAGKIHVQSGKVIATTTSQGGGAILGHESFTIADGAHVTERWNIFEGYVPTEKEQALISAGKLTFESNQ